jgi:tetratricopeptide (TPR) repeat protein
LARASYRRDLAVSHNNLGLTQTELGQSAEAEASFREALDFQELLVGQQPRDVGMQSSLGGIYNNLGIVLEGLHRIPEAAAAYQQAVKYQQAAFARASTVARYRVFLSKHYFNYGRVLRQLGDGDQAHCCAHPPAGRRPELYKHDAPASVSTAHRSGRNGDTLACAACL